MYIAHAVALDAPRQRTAALLQLARVASDPATFDATFDGLRRSREAGIASDPMITDATILEVQLRGLLTTGRAGAAAEMINKLSWTAGAASPQWAVIRDITVASVMFTADSDSTAAPLLERAIASAVQLRLPHQIQRAQRVARRHRPELVAHAADLLNDLSGGTRRTG